MPEKLSESEFLGLINQHQGILHKVSKMYFDTPEDQQDLFQEIIFQLWKSAETFRGESKISSWIYRVAVNTAILFFKKETKHKKNHTTKLDVELATEEYKDTGDEQLKHFYQAVRQLNKIEKALIFQCIEGLTGKEIANNLGISEGNVRVKLNRTKKKLQEIIKSQGYGL